MSQSPKTSTDPSEEYVYSWVALSEFLAAGGSLSGREANCCYLNTQTSAFADISAVAGFNQIDDGRAVAVCDWDFDGALDLWIANRTGPRVRFLHNNLPRRQHQFISLQLQGTKSNRDAIGSRVTLEFEDGNLHRSLRAGEGFLSQSSKWIHFGFPQDRKPSAVRVRWPNGATERFEGVAPGKHYTLVEGAGKCKNWDPPANSLDLAARPLNTDASSGGRRRTILAGPFEIPPLEYLDLDGSPVPLVSDRQGVLVNLWSTSCKPCLEELADLRDHRENFSLEQLQLVALNVDEESQHQLAKDALQRIGWKSPAGFASQQLAQTFDILQRVVFSQRRPMPLPSSFLLDEQGRLAAIYVGRVDADRLMDDWNVVFQHDGSWQPAGLPFSGSWADRPAAASNTRTELIFEFMNAGYAEVARSLLGRIQAEGVAAGTSRGLAVAHLNLGAQLAGQNQIDDAADEFREALRLDPSLAKAHYALGMILKQQGQRGEALRHIHRATKTDPNYAEAHIELAMAYSGAGQARPAIAHAQAALDARPQWIAPMNLMARILALHPDPDIVDKNKALALAETAVNLTDREDAQSLATLAVVQGARRDFQIAIRTAEEGLRLAQAKGNAGLVAKLRRQLDRLRQESRRD